VSEIILKIDLVCELLCEVSDQCPTSLDFVCHLSAIFQVKRPLFNRLGWLFSRFAFFTCSRTCIFWEQSEFLYPFRHVFLGRPVYPASSASVIVQCLIQSALSLRSTRPNRLSRPDCTIVSCFEISVDVHFRIFY